MFYTGDIGMMPETDLIDIFWPGQIQPKTADPVFKMKTENCILPARLPGASIGYKYEEDEKPWIGWRVYNGTPLSFADAQRIKVISHRLGYAPSDVVTREK